jgi:hypothetical protein
MALLHTNASSWNRTTVLFVHGIGLHNNGYSEPLYQILRNADAGTVDSTRWHEVAYDFVGTELEGKVKNLNKLLPQAGQKPTLNQTAGDFLVDLVNYLFTTDPYNWINNVFRKALVDIIVQGQGTNVAPADHRVIMLAHSLGTVVAYEGLHSIVSDPQLPGLSSGFRIASLLTMGCPLAFIKANQARIPSLNSHFFLRSQPISRPVRTDTFSGLSASNIADWFNFRQKFDPVGSLVPLNQVSSNQSLSKETFVFNALNGGLNPHDFGNYVTQYSSFILQQIKG